MRVLGHRADMCGRPCKSRLVLNVNECFMTARRAQLDWLDLDGDAPVATGLAYFFQAVQGRQFRRGHFKELAEHLVT